MEVQLSPCVGGRLRTWTADGADQLWSVPRDEWLRTAQGTGALARTEIGTGMFRETGTLVDGALTVRPRLPVAAAVGGAMTMQPQTVELTAPRRASRATYEDFREVLDQAITRCIDAGEFLVIEPGGQPAGPRTFCLFAVMPDGADHVIVVETAPAPHSSELWAPYVDAANPTHTIAAPSTPETVTMVPTLLTEAIRDWDLDPWDLVFTFGAR